MIEMIERISMPHMHLYTKSIWIDVDSSNFSRLPCFLFFLKISTLR